MSFSAKVEMPILFKPRLVRAILDGTKTQTRRVITPQPRATTFAGVEAMRWKDATWPADDFHELCPYGMSLDCLWVRETWRKSRGKPYQYRADYPDDEIMRKPMKWKPSIFMPREASRIYLQITDVRVERLQDISEADAKAEGVKVPVAVSPSCPPGKAQPLYNALSPYKPLPVYDSVNHMFRWQFAHGWDEINKKRGFGWAKNPWLWVIEFRRVS